MPTEKQIEQLMELLQYTGERGGHELVIDMYKSLQFAIDMDQCEQEALLGYMASGRLEADAFEELEDAEIELKELRGNLDEYAREMEVLNRPTDSKVKAWIDRNEAYIAKAKAVASLRKHHKILAHFNKAYEKKLEVLPSRSARSRDKSEAPPVRRPKPPRVEQD